MFILLIGISILFDISNAFVLLQVTKQNDNLSNIDALIHKVVPSDKFENLARKMARNQHNNEQTQIKQENSGNELSLSVDENNSDPNLMKLIDMAIKQFTKQETPVLRSISQEIKPKTFKFRSGESSVLYELNSQSLISGLKELLSSKMVRTYLDNLTRKAAFVYRAMKDK